MKYSISHLMDFVEDDSVELAPREAASAQRVKELTMKKIAQKTTHKKNRRIAQKLILAAAAAAVLTGSAMAVNHYYSLGKVDDVTVNNRSHELIISEAFASPDGPETIQEYYLPTAYVSADDLLRFWVEYLVQDENGEYDWHYYEPTSSDPALRVKESPLLDTPTDIYYAWDLTGERRLSVSFHQTVAKYFDNGAALVKHGTGDLPTDLYSFELDEYEVYVFAILATDGSGAELSRTWYWTDGDYLFELFCVSDLSDEAMTEIFRSIQPVGNEIPYLAEFN